MSTRRAFVSAGSAGLLAAATSALRAQQRDYSQPARYPDADIVALDNRFRRYMIGNTPIQRLFTGGLWMEGPAWNGNARCLVWSDIPNNRQFRWAEEDGHVSVYRNPSGYSNGNTFDYEGRQLSCEHAGRRVVRYEPNGTQTVIAEKFQGKRLNSPNDIAVHPDGGIWFTDPTYGINGDYEGFHADSETPPAVYRADPKTGALEKVAGDQTGPNGVCFSPDYKKFYVADTGNSRQTWVYDIDGAKLKNGKAFVQLKDGANPSAADGIRCDKDGNIWCGAAPGVQIVAPDGTPIGVIRLPENCANICFGGTKRNRLLMTASQSLFSVYVGVQGAHIA